MTLAFWVEGGAGPGHTVMWGWVHTSTDIHVSDVKVVVMRVCRAGSMTGCLGQRRGSGRPHSYVGLGAHKYTHPCFGCKRCCNAGVQGREHDWLFGSEEGQWQVAEQCRAARLILLSLNRGHHFASLKVRGPSE